MDSKTTTFHRTLTELIYTRTVGNRPASAIASQLWQEFTPQQQQAVQQESWNACIWAAAYSAGQASCAAPLLDCLTAAADYLDLWSVELVADPAPDSLEALAARVHCVLQVARNAVRAGEQS